MTITSAERSALDVSRDLLVDLPGAATTDDNAPSFYDELLNAAARHQRCDPRSRGVWHEVLMCLRLTSLALQLEASGEDAGAQGVAVAYALSAGRRSSVSLRRRLRVDQRRLGRTLGVSYPTRPGSSVERTSLHLTGLMLGACPADLEFLEAALASHNDALERWRAMLTEQVRSASAAAIPDPRRCG